MRGVVEAEGVLDAGALRDELHAQRGVVLGDEFDGAQLRGPGIHQAGPLRRARRPVRSTMGAPRSEPIRAAGRWRCGTSARPPAGARCTTASPALRNTRDGGPVTLAGRLDDVMGPRGHRDAPARASASAQRS